MKINTSFRLLLATIFILIASKSSIILAQNTKKPRLLPAYIDAKGDTIPIVYLYEYDVYGKRSFKSWLDQQRYDKLYRNVRIAYPYAKEAGRRIKEVNQKVALLPQNSPLRKQYLKEYEDYLKTEFSDDLRQMTVSQGRILIKLIDRETSTTSYQVIKEFRGGFSATVWQSLALVFGTNLKADYDPQKDADIEAIINQLEASNNTQWIRTTSKN